MVISQNTATEIDSQVAKGLSIGYFGKGDDLSLIPRMIGDWNIRTIEEQRSPGTGYIVAVPSNTRTRLIYAAGRIAWLVALGYSEQTAHVYLKASSTVAKRWDHEVAQFVLTNYGIDTFILEQALSSDNPKKYLESQGYYSRVSRGKIIASCQILRNIRGLSK
ncbi:hypothetical protein RVBP21_0990 [Pseudomonas phage BRkr]|nr:hypothetical protein RVBP21_0990 [Pseudomonas phage BRkr]